MPWQLDSLQKARSGVYGRTSDQSSRLSAAGTSPRAHAPHAGANSQLTVDTTCERSSRLPATTGDSAPTPSARHQSRQEMLATVGCPTGTFVVYASADHASITSLTPLRGAEPPRVRRTSPLSESLATSSGRARQCSIRGGPGGLRGVPIVQRRITIDHRCAHRRQPPWYPSSGRPIPAPIALCTP